MFPEVMSNPFYVEVSALYEQLQPDGLIQEVVR